jgi:hypothetical protein
MSRMGLEFWAYERFGLCILTRLGRTILRKVLVTTSLQGVAHVTNTKVSPRFGLFLNSPDYLLLLSSTTLVSIKKSLLVLGVCSVGCVHQVNYYYRRFKLSIILALQALI